MWEQMVHIKVDSNLVCRTGTSDGHATVGTEINKTARLTQRKGSKSKKKDTDIIQPHHFFFLGWGIIKHNCLQRSVCDCEIENDFR